MQAEKFQLTISYDETNGGNFVKIRQVVLKLAHEARYHLNGVQLLQIDLSSPGYDWLYSLSCRHNTKSHDVNYMHILVD